MRFTLTYAGPLPAKGNTQEKEQIRAYLAPQLEELWQHEPLRNFRPWLVPPESTGGALVAPSVLVERGNQTYAPLVCEALNLRAELDVTMLRPERPGRIVTTGGDIDNRLKTLFDALSAPQNADQVSSTARPSDAAHPMFTLLKDDALITRVNVDTDCWLAAPSPDKVQLTIRVILRASRIMYGNQILIS